MATAPTLTGFAPTGTFIAGRSQIIDGDVVFGDADGDFLGGRLVLTGILANDVLGVYNRGTGAGQIGVSGTTVTYGGVAIGTLSGGNGQALTISFVTSGASPSVAAIDALIQSLTLTAGPTAGNRTLDLNVIDATGLSLRGAAAFTELTAAANPFNGIDTGRLASPRFIDLDGDGDRDAIVGGDSTGGFLVFRNNGTGQAFTALTGADDPLDGIENGTYSRPGVVDLDGDGDLDLVASDQGFGKLQAYRNNGAGQPFTPLSGAANPFDAIDNVGFSAPGFVDLDGDGDLDMVITRADDGTVRSFRNNGVSVPVSELSGAANPFNGFRGLAFATTDFIDLDGDGDLDAVFGTIDGSLRAFRNNGVNQAFTELTGTANPLNRVNVGRFAAIGVVDLDDDGDLDVVIGTDNQTDSLYTFRNTSAARSQVASVVVPNAVPTLAGLTTSLTVAENAGPTLIDADVTLADAEGNWNGGRVGVTGLQPEDVVTVRNQGTGAGQIGVSGNAVSYGGVIFGTIAGGAGSALTVTFNAAATNAAVDALVQNLAYGNVSENPAATRQLKVSVTDGAGGSAIGAATYTFLGANNGSFGSESVGRYAKAAFIDMDGDGDLDAVVGQPQTAIAGSDRLQFLRNVAPAGSPAQFVEQLDNPFAALGSFTRGFPATVDLDGDGDLDLVVGSDSSSSLRTFRNTGAAGGAASFVELTGTDNPFNGLTGRQLAAGFTDLNADGRLDLVLGQLGGTFRSFVNTAPVGATASYTELSGAQNPLNGVTVGNYSTPTFADLDGDGDLDLISGQNGAALRVFINTASLGQPVSYRAATAAENPFTSLAYSGIGQRSSASFLDVDGDGDLDVFAAGNFNDRLNAFRNDALSVNVNVTAAADAPVVANVQGDTAIFKQGQGTLEVYVDSGLNATVTDVDSANFNGGSLVVRVDGGTRAEDFIYFNDSNPAFGLSVNGNTLSQGGVAFATFTGPSANRSFSFDANATPERVTQLIRSLTYFNNNTTNPVTGAHTIAYTLTDGSGGTTTTTASVIVRANVAPSSTGFNDAVFTEGDPSVLLDAGFDQVLTDPDSANFDGGKLTFGVTGNKAAGEDGLSFLIGGTSFLSVQGNQLFYRSVQFATFSQSGVGLDRTFTFNANATVEAVQTIMRNLVYFNRSDTPSTAQRTIQYVLTDGDGGTLTLTSKVDVVATDDAPVASPDSGTVAENATVTIDVVANDTDVDGGPKFVNVVDRNLIGSPPATVTLASGATATLNADGTITYNPNGAFNYLVSAATGAMNGAASRATDSFTYQLNSGAGPDVSVTTVTVTITGVDGPGDQLRGTQGDNVITGTAGADVFVLSQGGDDDVSGGAGNDTFLFGTTLTTADLVNGGSGADVVAVQGSYAGLRLGAGSLTGVETLSLLSGSDGRFGDTANNRYGYNVATVDANVAAGTQLIVNGAALLSGESLVFDGSAETDGTFLIYGGAGTDTLTGGAGADVFFMADGRFNTGDRVIGGGGADIMVLRGDYTQSGTGAVRFAADTLTSVETVTLMSAVDTRFFAGGTRYRYDVTSNDGNVAAGATLTVNGAGLQADETMRFDGTAERDGAFRIFGGSADDVLSGGAGNDLIYGGLGADTLAGGAGNDVFRYQSAAESTSAGRDGIQDFTLGDLFDLTRIDANAGTAGDDAFAYIGGGAFTRTAGQLRVENSAGPIWTVQADIDGDGVADLEFIFVNADNHQIGASDFLL